MSMDIFVLSDRRLNSLDEWQRCIDAEGRGLALQTDASIDELHGFLPVRLAGVSTGFECGPCDVREVMKLYRGVDFGREWECGLVFVWRSLDECLTALLAAAAYAKATDGIVFDTHDGTVMSPKRTLELADELQREMPNLRATVEAMVSKLTSKRVG